jgi:hypothetical protein
MPTFREIGCSTDGAPMAEYWVAHLQLSPAPAPDAYYAKLAELVDRLAWEQKVGELGRLRIVTNGKPAP